MLPLLLLLATQPMPPHMYWMWEFPADLRQRNLQGAGVAFLLATAEQRDQRLVWRYRRQPLQLPPDVFRMAVVRLSVNSHEGIRRLDLVKYQRELAPRIVALAKQAQVKALQIDADVEPGQTATYLALLADLRRQLPDTFLSVTANLSWCRPGTWTDRAPVDEVLPMFFVRGTRGEPIPDGSLSARCRDSIGLLPGSPPPAVWTRKRVYFFVTGPLDFAVPFPK